MKNTLKTLLLASALIMPMAAYAAGQHGNDHSTHQHHEVSQHEDAVMGTGIIHNVSKLNKKINLTHAPIPALNWPEMTMDLDVADGVDLKGLSSGQAIKFHIKLGDDKVYRITKIMKTTKHDSKQCMQGEDCQMHEGMKHHGTDESHKHQKHMDDKHNHHSKHQGNSHGASDYQEKHDH